MSQLSKPPSSRTAPKEGPGTSLGRPAGPQSETTLRRGISILFALGSEEAVAQGGLGVKRVAELLGLEKSQISRTMKTLEQCGAVERDPGTLAYRLSWQMSTLASQSGDQQLLELARPVLAAMVEQLAESTFLSVLSGTEVRTVLAEMSRRVVQAVDAVGQTCPAYCTSAGRALLLDHTPEDLRLLFGRDRFPAYTPVTPADVEELIAALEPWRGNGFAVVQDEYEVGLTAIAAPVRRHGRIVGALNVSGPSGRLNPAVSDIGRTLADGADRLSSMLNTASRAIHV
jgi:IclR family KDG regulon transcriptional repressor